MAEKRAKAAARFKTRGAGGHSPTVRRRAVKLEDERFHQAGPPPSLAAGFFEKPPASRPSTEMDLERKATSHMRNRGGAGRAKWPARFTLVALFFRNGLLAMVPAKPRGDELHRRSSFGWRHGEMRKGSQKGEGAIGSTTRSAGHASGCEAITRTIYSFEPVRKNASRTRPIGARALRARQHRGGGGRTTGLNFLDSSEAHRGTNAFPVFLPNGQCSGARE